MKSYLASYTRRPAASVQPQSQLAQTKLFVGGETAQTISWRRGKSNSEDKVMERWAQGGSKSESNNKSLKWKGKTDNIWGCKSVQIACEHQRGTDGDTQKGTEDQVPKSREKKPRNSERPESSDGLWGEEEKKSYKASAFLSLLFPLLCKPAYNCIHKFLLLPSQKAFLQLCTGFTMLLCRKESKNWWEKTPDVVQSTGSGSVLASSPRKEPAFLPKAPLKSHSDNLTLRKHLAATLLLSNCVIVHIQHCHRINELLSWNTFFSVKADTTGSDFPKCWKTSLCRIDALMKIWKVLLPKLVKTKTLTLVTYPTNEWKFRWVWRACDTH